MHLKKLVSISTQQSQHLKNDEHKILQLLEHINDSKFKSHEFALQEREAKIRTENRVLLGKLIQITHKGVHTQLDII